MAYYYSVMVLLLVVVHFNNSDCLSLYSTITKILSTALNKNNVMDRLKLHSYNILRITDQIRTLPRQMKLLVSSAIESMILELTMPTDDKLREIDIHALQSIQDKFMGTGESKYINFHDHMIRKVLAKVSEKDWRTAGKSLYLVNQLLRNEELSSDETYHYAQSYLDRFESLHHTIESRIHDLNCLSEIESTDSRDSSISSSSPKVNILSRIAKLESWRFLLTYSKYIKQLCELISRRQLITTMRSSSSSSGWNSGGADSSANGVHLLDSLTMRGSTSILQLYSEYLSASNKLLHCLGLFQHAHQSQALMTNSNSRDSNDLYMQLSRTVMRSIIPREVLEASKQVMAIETASFQVYTRNGLSANEQLAAINNMKELNIVTSVIIHSLQSISRQYNYLCSQESTVQHYMDSQHQWLGARSSSESKQIHIDQFNGIIHTLMEQYTILSDKISSTITTDDESIVEKVDISNTHFTRYSYDNSASITKSSQKPTMLSRLFHPVLGRLNTQQYTAYSY